MLLIYVALNGWVCPSLAQASILQLDSPLTRDHDGLGLTMEFITSDSEVSPSATTDDSGPLPIERDQWNDLLSRLAVDGLSSGMSTSSAAQQINAGGGLKLLPSSSIFALEICPVGWFHLWNQISVPEPPLSYLLRPPRE